MTNIDNIIKKMNRRKFTATAHVSGADAVSYITNLIGAGESVGFGGSQTVGQIGLHIALNTKGRKIFHSSLADYALVKDSAFTSQWYICSANAITESGEIVNIDGTCNRVAGTIYGAPNVIIVAGVNKICGDLNSAIDRIRNVAAPPNACRLGRNTPCAVTGKCTDCHSEECMCSATVIMHHPSRGKNVYVVLINETLGY